MFKISKILAMSGFALGAGCMNGNSMAANTNSENDATSAVISATVNGHMNPPEPPESDAQPLNAPSPQDGDKDAQPATDHSTPPPADTPPDK